MIIEFIFIKNFLVINLLMYIINELLFFDYFSVSIDVIKDLFIRMI